MKSLLLILITIFLSVSYCYCQPNHDHNLKYETYLYVPFWEKSKQPQNMDLANSKNIKIDSVFIITTSKFDDNYLVTEIYLTNDSEYDLSFVASDSTIFADLYEVIEVADYEFYLNLESNGSLNKLGSFPKKHKFKYLGNYLDKKFPNWDERNYFQVLKNTSSKLICIIPKPTIKLGDYKITIEAQYRLDRGRYKTRENIIINSGLRIYQRAE